MLAGPRAERAAYISRCRPLSVYILGEIMEWNRVEKSIKLNAVDMRVLSKKCAPGETPLSKLLSAPVRSGLPPLVTQECLTLMLLESKKYKYIDFQFEHCRLLDQSNCAGRMYEPNSIPKANGGIRTVYEPWPDLKRVQRWILDNILKELPVSPAATAYIKGKSAFDNACCHVGKAVVIKTDIVSFFDSVKYPAVYDVFHSLAGYNADVSTLLANLCCLNGRTPQGAPTSPALANLAFVRVDCKILEYCSPRRIIYTRYADDMTFSSKEKFKAGELLSFLRRLLKAFGFEMNRDKTRVIYQDRCQKITGFVVNKYPNVSKEYTRRIRQETYYIQEYGLYNHLNKLWTEEYEPGDLESAMRYLRGLLGRIGYAMSTNGRAYEELENYRAYVERLIFMLESPMPLVEMRKHLGAPAVSRCIKTMYVDKQNCQRLMEYISVCDDKEGYDAMLSDYTDFLSEKGIQWLMRRRKRLFEKQEQYQDGI